MQSGLTVKVAITSLMAPGHWLAFTNVLPTMETVMVLPALASTSAFHCAAVSTMVA